MAESLYNQQVDPQVIQALLGKNWTNSVKLRQLAPNIFIDSPTPVQGSQATMILEQFFQDTAGQSVPIGGTIAAVGRAQTSVIHPNLWRDGAIQEDDKIGDIITKGVPGAMDRNAVFADSCRVAASQWFEDSTIKAIEGTAGALTSNQSGDGSDISLAGLVAAKGTLSDQGLMLSGGAVVMRGAVYWAAVGLGVVAATSNTFGNAAQDQIVRQGGLPEQVLGMAPLITDKLAAAPSSKEYVYFIGPRAIIVRGNEVPLIRMAEETVNRKFSTVTILRVHFGIGFKGVGYGGEAGPDVSDDDLATAGNWTLKDTNSKYVPLARYHTDE